MAKRKSATAAPTASDPATRFRNKLEARKAAAEAQRAERWSPSASDRLVIVFARLLYSATAPTTKSSGLRKRFLERRLFRTATRDAAHRKQLYRSSKAVLTAAKARNAATFGTAKTELTERWSELRSSQAGKR